MGNEKYTLVYLSAVKSHIYDRNIYIIIYIYRRNTYGERKHVKKHIKYGPEHAQNVRERGRKSIIRHSRS